MILGPSWVEGPQLGQGLRLAHTRGRAVGLGRVALGEGGTVLRGGLLPVVRGGGGALLSQGLGAHCRHPAFTQGRAALTLPGV